MTPTDALPDEIPAREAAWQTVARAAARLREAADAPPGLAELAAGAGLSPSHFQRLFAQWMGVSPKRYQQHLAGSRALAALQQGADLLAASATVGLSGPGRLHDLTVAVAAASPGEVKSGGAGMAIAWGVAATPLGPAFLASSTRGLMKLSFLADDRAGAILATAASTNTTATSTAATATATAAGGANASVNGADPATALAELHDAWPAAALHRDDAAAVALAGRIFSGWRGPEPLHLFVKGTQFQLRVWEALLRIPEGEVVTYGGLAEQLGDPGASRAVGGAVGANAIALLIPCHRVIRASGELGGYRWGEPCKRLLLAAELAWREQDGAAR